jgi:hypothetical protein
MQIVGKNFQFFSMALLSGASHFKSTCEKEASVFLLMKSRLHEVDAAHVSIHRYIAASFSLNQQQHQLALGNLRHQHTADRQTVGRLLVFSTELHLMASPPSSSSYKTYVVYNVQILGSSLYANVVWTGGRFTVPLTTGN